MLNVLKIIWNWIAFILSILLVTYNNNKTDEYDDECVYTCIIVNNFHIITFIYIYDTIVTFVTSICILLRYRYIYRYILFVFTTTILF